MARRWRSSSRSRAASASAVWCCTSRRYSASCSRIRRPATPLWTSRYCDTCSGAISMRTIGSRPHCATWTIGRAQARGRAFQPRSGRRSPIASGALRAARRPIRRSDACFGVRRDRRTGIAPERDSAARLHPAHRAAPRAHASPRGVAPARWCRPHGPRLAPRGGRPRDRRLSRTPRAIRSRHRPSRRWYLRAAAALTGRTPHHGKSPAPCPAPNREFHGTARGTGHGGSPVMPLPIPGLMDHRQRINLV